MRAWTAIGVVVLAAATVLVTDLLFKSTLLHTLWPVIVSPAESASVTAPVTVRWEGPQPLRVTLLGDGKRVDLGPSHSPLEVPASYFRRSGIYGLEIESPLLGPWRPQQRRFMVLLGEEEAAPAAAGVPDHPRDGDEPARALESVTAERDRLSTENAALGREMDDLKGQNDELLEMVEDLGEARAEADERVARLEAVQTELLEQHRGALEENALLRNRIASVPDCTTWGYVAYPRPQTIPPTRRLIIVSTGDAQMFRSFAECEANRRRDRTAASTCLCVATPWQGIATR